MRETKRLMKEMLIGIAAWGLLVLLILEILSRESLAMAAGVFAGTATAAGLLIHMYRHLDIALDMDEKGASRHTQIATLKRMAAMAVILAVSLIYYQYIHPIGTVLGIFGLKISALAQPVIHRCRKYKK